MTEEIAKTASELLKLKSQLLDDLSKIVDKPKENKGNWLLFEGYYYLSLCYSYSGGFSSSPSLNIDKNKEIKEKVKTLLVFEINKEIEKIDEQLKNLSC